MVNQKNNKVLLLFWYADQKETTVCAFISTLFFFGLWSNQKAVIHECFLVLEVKLILSDRLKFWSYFTITNSILRFNCLFVSELLSTKGFEAP
jgi:hypothetical protein